MSSAIRIGDTVRRTRHAFNGMNVGDMAKVTDVTVNAWATSVALDRYDGRHDAASLEIFHPVVDNVVPAHYAFPGGVRVHQVSGHLTSFGGQAVQYVARSTRLDGHNKGDSVENLRKAIRVLELEIERLGQS